MIFKNPLLYSANMGAPNRSVMQKHAFVQRRVRSSKFLFAQNPPDTAAENRFTHLKSMCLRDRLYSSGNYMKVRPCFDGSAVQVEELHEKKTKLEIVI